MKVLKRKILVIGASGVLGRQICKALNDVFGEYLELYIGDHQRERGLQTAASQSRSSYRHVDATDFPAITAALEGIDCVLVAMRQREPLIQKACFQKGVTCIDVGAFQAFAAQVYQLPENKETLSVVMGGFFPGLSGVIATSLAAEFQEVQEISVGLLQNSHGQVGLTGMADMFKILSTPLDTETPGFSKGKELTFFHSTYPVKEIQHDEKLVLQKKIAPAEIHYWTGWNQPRLTQWLSFFAKHNWLTRLTRLIYWQSGKRKSEDERVYLNVEVTGRRFDEPHSTMIDIAAKSDYGMTAFYAAMIADKSFISKKKGVRYPFEVMALEDFNYFDYDNYLKIKRYERELN